MVTSIVDVLEVAVDEGQRTVKYRCTGGRSGPPDPSKLVRP